MRRGPCELRDRLETVANGFHHVAFSIVHHISHTRVLNESAEDPRLCIRSLPALAERCTLHPTFGYTPEVYLIIDTRAKKIAAIIAAAGAIGVLGTACSDNSASDAVSSATSAANDIASQVTGATESGAAESDAAESGAASGAAASAPSTEIATNTELTTASGENITIDDEAIAASYGERGGPEGYLGKPLGPVVTLPTGGKYITLENGSLYKNPASGGVFAVHGAIGGEWGTLNHEQGKLGYPTSEETKVDGGLEQTFDNGTLVFKDGKVTEKG